jgi:hypothetical protein
MGRYRNTLIVMLNLAILAGCAAAFAADAKVLKAGDNYTVSATVRKPNADTKGLLGLVIEPKAGWKMSLEAPIKVMLTPADGLQLDKKLLKKDDLAEKTKQRYRFDVPYLSNGSAALKLKFDFVLCTDKMCQKKRFDVELTL